ncbi:MAG TPA: hypothetical protein VFH43_05890 [Candidatus Kapabacteria bacterium]|nr:hypothetical protein [Candidatus Kapabacteria bacterium]
MSKLLILFILLATPHRAAAQSDTASTSVTAAEEVAEEIPEETSTIDFSLTANGGATFNSIDQSEDEKTENVQWVTGLRSSFNLTAEPFQLYNSVYAQYGQLHEDGALPQKTKDNLIVTVMPSIAIFPGSTLRLFLETTGETTMGDGDIDDIPTKFLDPLFLYQTLFVGQKHHDEAEEGDWSFDLIYGIGYALQQTFAKQFVLEENREFVIGEGNPITSVQDQVSLESGYSAVFQLEYQSNITELFNFNMSLKTVALTKTPSVKTLSDSRVSGLLLGGLSYGIISADYTMKLTYDKNYSTRRMLDQGLVFGLKLKI